MTEAKTDECKKCRAPIELGALCDGCAEKALLRCYEIEQSGERLDDDIIDPETAADLVRRGWMESTHD